MTGADDLDLPSVTYNSRRGQYLAVWHGAMRATGYNIYAREVSASGVVSPTIVAVCEATRDQKHPSVAYDAQADQYWAVWEDKRSGGANQIYAQRLSSLGTPSGAEIAVSTSTNVAADARLACGGGRCVIVWAESYSETLEVYARAYDAGGNALTPAVRVSTVGSIASEPDVAYNSTAGQYLVVWSEQHAGTGSDVKGQVLNGSLSPTGAAVSVCAATGDQDQARVAYNPHSNYYCAVWRDRRSGTSWDIYGQILTSAGQLRGGALSLYAGGDNDGEPAIAARDNADQFLVSFGADQFISMREHYPYIRACTVSGAGVVGSTFDVRRVGVNRRWSPAVAHRAGSDEYLVVWVDGYFWPGDIMAQRVRGDRMLLGSAFMACATRKGQEEPAVAHNSQRDQYLVVWEDFRSGLGYGIYARRLSATGAPLGQELAIATAGQLNRAPVVAYNPQRDEYLVVWYELHSPQTGYDIYARRLSATGQLLDIAIWVSRDSGTGSEYQPVAACNRASGEYLVAWNALRNNSWDVCAQRLSGSGGLLGTILWLTGAGHQSPPRVAYNPQQNGYLVAWGEHDEGDELRGRRVSSAGTLVGGELVLVDSGPGGFDLAHNETNNEYLVVSGTEDDNIQGQRLDGTGGRLGSPFAISATEAEEGAPVVCYNGRSGQYTVVWQEFHEATDWDIYGRQVSAAGSPLGDKFAVATAPEFQSDAALTANSATGEVLIVWQDFRNDNWDIYGQRWIPPFVPTTPTVTPTATPTRTATRTATPQGTVTPTPTGAGATSVFLPLLLRGR